MPVTAPQVQLNPRHLSSTTLTAQLLNSATQMQVASGAIFDTLPTAALLTDGVNTEIVSVDSLVSGTTYNITRAIEPGTAAATFPANTTQVKLIIAAETLRRLQRGFRERTTGMVNVKEYGAVGDGTARTGSITGGTTLVTIVVGTFVAADVGKKIVIKGAGASGAPLVTTIASYVSATQVNTTATASTTVSLERVVWGTDDTAAIQAAVASLSTGRGGRIYLPPAIYVISGTIALPSHCEVWGHSAGTFPLVPNNPDYLMGTVLTWAGATNSTMVSLIGTQGTLVHGVNCNGDVIAGVTGFLIDSVNSPSGQLNTLEHFACWNCAVGVQWGTTQAGVLPPPNNAYQNDSTVLRRFWISAPELAASAKGIVINSTNTQASQIEQGVIQSCKTGVYYRVGSGFSTMDRVIFGACDTAILTTPFSGELLFKNVQSEGTTYLCRATNQVDDAGTLYSTLTAITFLTCHLDNAITVTGGQAIITIGCNATTGVIYTCNHAQSNVISIGDALPSTWVMTQGTLWQIATRLGGVFDPVTVLPTLQVGSTTTGAVWKRHLTATLSITGATWGAIAQDATATQNITVTGAIAGDSCIVTPDTPMGAGLVWNAYCSANGFVTVRMTNTAGSQTPATATWRATVLGY